MLGQKHIMHLGRQHQRNIGSPERAAQKVHICEEKNLGFQDMCDSSA